MQRREAESAKALLEFGRDLAAAEGLEQVLERIVEGAQQLMAARRTPRSGSRSRPAATSSARPRAVTRPDARSSAAVSQRRGHAAVRRPNRALRDRPGGVRGASATRRPEGSGSYVVAPFTLEGRWGAIAVAFAPERRVRRPRAGAARRARAPGEARDRERVQLRRPRAHVPLDRRGARQRARGAGRVHLLARALDHRHGDARRAARSVSTATR